jgi:tripartite-type tricarboxylate transporter receptor subunit TctC
MPPTRPVLRHAADATPRRPARTGLCARAAWTHPRKVAQDGRSLRRLLAGIGATALAVYGGVSFAQDYPTRPVRLLVGFTAGGGTDSVARIFGTKLAENLGQSVVIDNRAGAGGNIAAVVTARAAPDGYTLHIVPSSFATNPSLYSSAGYDPVKEFAPVTFIASSAYVLETHPKLPARTVKEFVALARAKPGQFNYASGGTGTPSHLGIELLKSMTGMDIVHVPYKGGGLALADLIGGQVSLYLDPLVLAMPYVQSGRTRALAVSSATRVSVLPDVPTIAESGVPGFEMLGWYAIVAPAGTPRRIVDILHGHIARTLQSPDVRSRFLALGIDPVGQGPEELARFMRAEIDKWTKVIRASGAKVD